MFCYYAKFPKYIKVHICDMTDHSKIIIACINGCSPNYGNSLKAAGYSNILVRGEDEDIRSFFRRTLLQSPDFIITLDEGDGFSTEDVTAVMNALSAQPQAFYAGVKKSSEKTSLPSKLFGFLSGIEAANVQTSLFGMSAENFKILTDMKSSEERFMTNLPLEARAKDISVKSVETGAPPAPQPGFDLLACSLKLYYVFIKFSISALIAYLVDIGTFYLFVRLFHQLTDEYKILISTVLSRVLCSVATYLLNKGMVFGSKAPTGGTVVRFLILATAQLIASWLLVWIFGSLLGGSAEINMIVKVVVDLVIFMASFTIQRDWVFKQTKGLLK